jgi:hypothetical protein
LSKRDLHKEKAYDRITPSKEPKTDVEQKDLHKEKVYDRITPSNEPKTDIEKGFTQRKSI